MVDSILHKLKYPGNSVSLLLLLRPLAFILLVTFASVGEAFFPNVITFIHWPLLSLSIILATALSAFNLLFKQHLNETIHVFMTLAGDSLIWFIAIAATGAAINPAVSYVLVLLCVAALTLPISFAITIFILMSIAYGALMLYAPHHHHAMMMSWHLWGMWILFIINAIIMVWVIFRLNTLIRKKDEAIARFREETVRDEQLIAFGTLAAAVTHEIGNPLSTIALLVEDSDDEDSKIIQQQVQRCKKAIASLKESGSHVTSHITVDAFFNKLKQEILLIKPHSKISWLKCSYFFITSSIKLEHALLALIHNATEACEHEVIISAESNDRIIIDILHDGKSIEPQLLQQLGQQVIDSDKKEGLGVGYYLANASIEQLGGSVDIRNTNLGVLTRVHLPLSE